MNDEHKTIKNKMIEKQIEDHTKDNPAMREFLLEIIGQGYASSHFRKTYNKALDTALKKEGNI